MLEAVKAIGRCKTRNDGSSSIMKLDSSISAVVTGGASGLGKATVKALREFR